MGSNPTHSAKLKEIALKRKLKSFFVFWVLCQVLWFNIIGFFNKDWGDLCEENIQLNEEAMEYKGLVHGAYNTSEARIWIIAESQSGAEYDTITVLFPEDY